MKMITILQTTIISVGIVLTNTANAAFPIGLWQISHYDITNKTKINSGLPMCIISDGTIKGVASEISWHGNWRKSGDSILIRANNTDNVSIGSWSLTAINSKLMTGYNQSWNILDTSSGFYTTSVWEFKSTVCP